MATKRAYYFVALFVLFILTRSSGSTATKSGKNNSLGEDKDEPELRITSTERGKSNVLTPERMETEVLAILEKSHKKINERRYKERDTAATNKRKKKKKDRKGIKSTGLEKQGRETVAMKAQTDDVGSIAQGSNWEKRDINELEKHGVVQTLDTMAYERVGSKVQRIDRVNKEKGEEQKNNFHAMESEYEHAKEYVWHIEQKMEENESLAANLLWYLIGVVVVTSLICLPFTISSVGPCCSRYCQLGQPYKGQPNTYQNFIDTIEERRHSKNKCDTEKEEKPLKM